MGFLLAIHCPPVGLPEESDKHSHFYKPEPQTDWRWPRSDQMLFDVHSIWNMCPQCWTDSRLWTSSHAAQLQVSELLRVFCISLWLREKDVQRELFFVRLHTRESVFEHLECVFLWVQIKAVLLCCFAVLGWVSVHGVWVAFMKCCWASQWLEPA